MANPEAKQVQTEKRSLYVGDLDPKVTSTDLFQAFSEMGTLNSVRVCYDSLSGNSLCYGYVNFLTPLQATKALNLMNHTNLKGKPMRIMWCERNPSTRKPGIANLFVKNLDHSIDSARLESIFGKFGTVISCKIAEDGNGKSKGFGFVQFDKQESAVAALTALHDTFLEGKKLYVGNFIKSSQRKQTFTNLYVKNLNKDLTEDDLKEKFSKFGKVTSAVIMRESQGNSKGFGFVSFESPEEAKTAMEALNGTSLLGGETLFVGRAQKKAERAKMMDEGTAKWKASTLFVKNLDPSVNENLLKSYFRPSGIVTWATVVRHRNGTSKGFGFVTFSNPTDASRATVRFHGSTLQGKPLYVAMARSKEEKGNYPLPVKEISPPLPYYPAGKSATPFSSVKPDMHKNSQWEQDLRSNKCLKPHPATGTGNPENHKLFPKTTTLRSSIRSSTRSSSARSNIVSHRNLHLSFEKAQIKGMELKIREPEQGKLSASPNSLTQFVMNALQMSAQSPNNAAASMPLKKEGA